MCTNDLLRTLSGCRFDQNYLQAQEAATLPEPRILKFYGSGTTWRQGKNDPRCDSFTSEWLHGIWNRELNRKLEAENCAKTSRELAARLAARATAACRP